MAMQLEVPVPIREFIAQLDARAEPIDDFLTVPVAKPADGTDWPPELRRGAYAEVVALQFMRPNMFERRSPWGTYWSELASGTAADGSAVYMPNADHLDTEIIEHWIVRAGQLVHPTLRARFADLAWEFGHYLRKRSRKNGDQIHAGIRIPPAVAHQAIDSYLEVVRRRLAEDHCAAWQYVNRAIELSKALRDEGRVAQCRAAMLDLRNSVRAVNGRAGQTWRFYQIAARHFERDFTPEELKQILSDLQAELREQTDPGNHQAFDPHAAMNTAERLRRWGIISCDSRPAAICPAHWP